jgi:hypothetical protein
MPGQEFQEHASTSKLTVHFACLEKARISDQRRVDAIQAPAF